MNVIYYTFQNHGVGFSLKGIIVSMYRQVLRLCMSCAFGHLLTNIFVVYCESLILYHQ